MCDAADAVGPLVTDAVIAVIAAEHGCTVATKDRDFARFRSVGAAPRPGCRTAL